VDEGKPLGGGTEELARINANGADIRGRGLNSSTYRLNVSTFYGIRWVL